MYTTKSSTNVDWLIWLKITEDLFTVISIVSVNEFRNTLSPVCWCAGKRQKANHGAVLEVVSSDACTDFRAGKFAVSARG